MKMSMVENSTNDVIMIVNKSWYNHEVFWIYGWAFVFVGFFIGVMVVFFGGSLMVAVVGLVCEWCTKRQRSKRKPTKRSKIKKPVSVKKPKISINKHDTVINVKDASMEKDPLLSEPDKLIYYQEN